MKGLSLAHRRSRSGSHDHGYSLMEVLVMLAITAVVSTLVLQTIRSAAANGVRIERHSRTTIHDRLDVTALRRAMSGALIDYAGSGEVFRGTSDTATGLTARPMSPGARNIAAFRLVIETDASASRLVYEEAGRRYRILDARDAELRLSYWWDNGQSGRWIAQWPPQEGFVGPDYPSVPFYAPVPQLIRIAATGGDSPFELVLGLPQTMPPQARPDDLFGTSP